MAGTGSIQALSTIHGACYADYSDGIRLASETVLLDGATRSAFDRLGAPRLAPILSDEDPIPGLRDFLRGQAVRDPAANGLGSASGSDPLRRGLSFRQQ